MIIKINDNCGKNIAKCEIFWDECDCLRLSSKENIKNIYDEMEQGDCGFTECIEIDIDKIYNRKKIANDVVDDIVTNFVGEEYTQEVLDTFVNDYFSKETEIIRDIVDENMAEYLNSDMIICNNRRE